MKSIIRVLMIILCVFLYYSLSCAGGDGGGDSTAETADLEEETRPEWYDCLSEEAKELFDDPNLSEEGRLFLWASADCPVEPNTIDKIFAAEEAGTIDEITAHLNRLFAYLDPDQVDPQLRGAEVTPGDSIVNMELQWLHDNFESFSPEDQEKLMKFILPPADPNSIFHPPVEITDAKIAKSTTDFMPMITMESPGRWKIFYYPTWINKAQQINDALETAWPIFKNFFRGLEPTEEVYVYIADIGENDNGSNTMTVIDGAKRCKTGIHVDIKDDIIRQGTTVHELFHCFHEHLFLSLGNTFYAPHHNAIAEAAAKFAEHLVFPGNNTEQYALKVFFPSLNDYRLKHDGTHEYGTYMWPFFVNQQFGLDKVQEIIFQTAEVLDPRELFVLPVPDYTKEYAEFAFYNQNWPEPLHKYVDVGDFPTMSDKCGVMCVPNGKSTRSEFYSEPGKRNYAEIMEPGGIMYNTYNFRRAKDRIKQVKISYKGIDDIPDLNRYLYVILKTREVKLLGDRNAEGVDTFCFDKPEEHLEELTLILSNASMINKNKIEYYIEAFPDCELMGTTKITLTGERNVTFVSKDKIEMIPDPDTTSNEKFYVLTERVMSYYDSWSYETNDPITLINLRVDGECSGDLTETYAPEDGIMKFELDPDNGKGSLYPYPDPFELQWISCTQTVITDGVEDVTTWDAAPLTLFPEEAATLNALNIERGRIKGEIVVPALTFGGEATLTFEYMR